MTIDYAKTLRCPYKPILRNFEGATLPTCEPKGCICWIKTSDITYTDMQSTHKGTIADFLGTHPGYVHIRSKHLIHFIGHYFGIPHPIEQGYCTLRGDIDDN